MTALPKSIQNICISHTADYSWIGWPVTEQFCCWHSVLTGLSRLFECVRVCMCVRARNTYVYVSVFACALCSVRKLLHRSLCVHVRTLRMCIIFSVFYFHFCVFVRNSTIHSQCQHESRSFHIHVHHHSNRFFALAELLLFSRFVFDTIETTFLSHRSQVHARKAKHSAFLFKVREKCSPQKGLPLACYLPCFTFSENHYSDALILVAFRIFRQISSFKRSSHAWTMHVQWNTKIHIVDIELKLMTFKYYFNVCILGSLYGARIHNLCHTYIQERKATHWLNHGIFEVIVKNKNRCTICVHAFDVLRLENWNSRLRFEYWTVLSKEKCRTTYCWHSCELCIHYKAEAPVAAKHMRTAEWGREYH